ncbi:MAG TPA: transcription antitermination factor NusB [Bdellovibrionota bacterium]|nr:transcription antitermination factor NusB [Bdellovibrionota bacterium]
MTTGRRKGRETAFQILYRYDLGKQESGTTPPEGDALDLDLTGHFEHFGTPEEQRPFATGLVRGILERLAELDELLERHARNWRVSRMAFVDRTLLRLAAYEILYAGIPVSVAIDEALELGKQFGTSDTAPFLNGILDAIAREKTDGQSRPA